MTTPTNELTAEQAKKISIDSGEKRFTNIMKEIRKAAEDGYTGYRLSLGCSPQLEQKLIALGYRVERQGKPETVKVNW